jgi:hypothetical protein
MVALTRRPERFSAASASISTSIALTGRNSPTETTSVASGWALTAENSASPTPLRTTRTMARGRPILARNNSAA